MTVGGFALELSLQHWIKDGAMTIFFFVVGLEIKREMVHGELREPRKAVLPVVAALGATLLCRCLGVRALPVYVIIGMGIWLAVLMAGIHATVAGVALGLLTPSNPWLADRSLLKVLSGTKHQLREDRAEGNEMEHHEDALLLLGATAQRTISPLDRLETALRPWVGLCHHAAVHRWSGTQRRTSEVRQDRCGGRICTQRDGRLHVAVVVFEERIPAPEMMLRAVVSRGKTIRRMIFWNPICHWVGAPTVGLFALFCRGAASSPGQSIGSPIAARNTNALLPNGRRFSLG